MSIADALKILKYNKPYLNRSQIKTLKGQIVSGNIAGAMKGLQTIKRAKQYARENS